MDVKIEEKLEDEPPAVEEVEKPAPYPIEKESSIENDSEFIVGEPRKKRKLSRNRNTPNKSSGKKR